MQIKKTAVLGAGTMGSGIAAHMANAGAEVVLLDIVPKGANDRNILAKKAIEKMKENPHLLTHPRRVDQIIPGNFEDDMGKLEDVDWILEAVVENADIKQDLYQRVDKARKKKSIVSSNTSTLPLDELKSGQSDALKQDLYITHFFNPPRQMRLLELVADNENTPDKREALTSFIEKEMGKTIVPARDTPGFIANRIGIFWLMQGLEQAMQHDIPVELADALLGKPLGFPKTGIFGLFDLIGLDLMLDITRSMQEHLPEDDPYQQFRESAKLLEHMVDNDLTGNKGDGGFYRKGRNGREVYDLKKRSYRAASEVEDSAIEAAENNGLHAALTTDSQGGRYAGTVLFDTLHYTASLIPEIADDILAVDTAMRLGFNWQQGPFEMIDQLGNTKLSGVTWFADALRNEDRDVPELIDKASEKSGFYKTKNSDRYYFTSGGEYRPIKISEDCWQLADKTRGRKPVLENKAARLWDIGDGIACLELVTKMDTMDHTTFDLIEQAIERVESDFQGMIIGDDDTHFSAGLNLHRLLEWCDKEDWDAVEHILERGQQTMLALKYAPFPVVGAPAGKALGGACEMLLHCDAVQAHIESHIGLVEVRIGVVPGWGGCKEMLVHQLKNAADTASQVQAAETVFSRIADARPSRSAEEARDWRILQGESGITMHRDRILPDTKALCLKMAEGYRPPEASVIELPRAAVKAVLEREVDARKQKNLSTHDKHVLQCLAFVISGGLSASGFMKRLELEAVEDREDDSGVPTQISEEDMLALERRAFMALVKTAETQKKIRKVL